MAILVRIPTPLQKLTGDKAEVTSSGGTIQELIQDLDRQFPGLKDRLCDAEGRLRRFVNVYVNEEDIRFLKQEATTVKDGDEVSIIPAIAGGSGSPRRALAGGRGVPHGFVGAGGEATRLTASRGKTRCRRFSPWDPPFPAVGPFGASTDGWAEISHLPPARLSILVEGEVPPTSG